MRITLVYDENEIAFDIAARAVRKHLLNPSIKTIVVENDTYLVRHLRGSKVYEVISADSIQQYFRK